MDQVGYIYHITVTRRYQEDMKQQLSINVVLWKESLIRVTTDDFNLIYTYQLLINYRLLMIIKYKKKNQGGFLTVVLKGDDISMLGRACILIILIDLLEPISDDDFLSKFEEDCCFYGIYSTFCPYVGRCW